MKTSLSEGAFESPLIFGLNITVSLKAVSESLIDIKKVEIKSIVSVYL